MRIIRRKLLVASLLVCWTSAAALQAETAIGDWGHFLSYTPTICLSNSEGKAFTVKVHVMQWGTQAWARDRAKLRLTDPDGAIVADGEHTLEDSTVTLNVKAGTAGVYRLHTTDNVWVWSSLDRSVIWTGVPGRHLMDDGKRIKTEDGKKRKPHFYEKEGHVVFQASVPRRWWFWVPEEVTEFSCTAMRADRCMSQREDWGYFILTPRGQRIRALWGQPPHTSGRNYHQEQRVDVEVEPGAAGRFWCLEVRLGDSHHYSNINFGLDGVPPYLARSPEEWFDPETGQPPAIPLYDETPFIQSARIEGMEERWPNLQHFSPCPSLGDPDGIEVLGAATYAFWNPENRALKYRIGTYLPRKGFKSARRAQVRITNGKGRTILEDALPMQHIHGKHGKPSHTLENARGVCRVAVADVERFLTFTYPATPLVLVGQDQADGWKRFSFTACGARNWYFFVPRGTERFQVKAKAWIETDVFRLDICAPDRVLAVLYANEDDCTVRVPPGLDNKIWYLRPSVGSATRMITKQGPDTRYQDLPLTLDLKGVPGYLAPTWEQWFDPERPAGPLRRGTAKK